MISQKLHIAIEKWIKVGTWHTSHPSDDERFYALLVVIESDGVQNFDVDDFIDVASELVIRHYPKMKREFISQNVNDKAMQAEAIMGYLAFRRRHEV